jgi:PRC-barrel domain
MLREEELRAVSGLDVVDENGKSIGNVEYLFNDDETGEPEWLGLVTGTFRRQHVLVPVQGVERAGPSLRVPWPKDQVKRAPAYGEREAGGILGLGHYSPGISKEKEREAYAHYGLAEAHTT